MAIDVNKLSEKVFKALKSYQLSLSLYTETGESTLSPSEARRFYNEKNNIMVNLETSDNVYKLKINIGKNNDINEIRPLLDVLKNIARTYNIQYVLRTFDKKIEPKDFAYQVATVTEGFTRPWGTVKTSRRKFENATLYIRHSKRVDEEKRGSRSRNIQSIFIENSQGERFKFPYNNISAAKTMCVHVSEGGTPYDQNGRKIVEITKEQEKLKEFINYTRKNNSLNETSINFMESVKNRIFELKNIINGMNSKAGYHRFFESLKEIEEEADFSLDILGEYGIVVEQNQEELTPYLGRIATHLKESTEKEKNLRDFYKRIVNSQTFEVSEEIDNTDPDNPANLTFKDEKSSLSALAGYLSTLAVDDNASKYLRQLSDDVYQFSENYVNFTKKLLTYLQQSAKVATGLEMRNESISKSAVNQIVKNLSKFDI